MEKENVKKQIEALVRKYLSDIKVPKLPVRYGGSVHEAEEAVEMVNAVLDGWWVHGKRTDQFEASFSKYLGVKYSLFCNSGSSALIIGTDALKLPKGSEVISPALTFPTTINPAIRQGLKTVLVDSHIGTYNADIDQVEQAITKNTKAIILPHILGNATDMKRLMQLVEEHGLVLLEDCCEAMGSTYKGRMLGTLGSVSTFSFYPSHHITAGGGGMASTNSEELYKTMLSLKSWGRRYSDKKHMPNQQIIRSDYVQQYTYDTIGYSLYATEMQAALGLVQMRKIRKFEKIRDRNFAALLRFFKGYKDLFILPRVLNGVKPVWFAFPLTIVDSARINREVLMDFIYKKQVEARYILSGNIAKQPAYSDVDFITKSGLPNADKIHTDSFFIGLYQGMDAGKLSYLKECFADFLGNA